MNADGCKERRSRNSTFPVGQLKPFRSVRCSGGRSKRCHHCSKLTTASSYLTSASSPHDTRPSSPSYSLPVTTVDAVPCVRNVPLFKGLKERKTTEVGYLPRFWGQEHSDGGYIGIYTPQNQSTLQIFMWILVVFFLFDARQIVVDFEIGMTS